LPPQLVISANGYNEGPKELIFGILSE